MIYRIVITLFIILSISQVASARVLNIRFIPSYDGKEIVLEKYYYTLKGDSIRFSTFRCYISAVQLYNKGQVIYREKDSYHLLDAEQGNMAIHLDAIPKYDAIQFNIGIDSVTNVSGVMGGDLDPTKGMYWAWQSGYINFKIEGKSNTCPTRNNEFAFHIGGYANWDKAIQQVNISAEASDELRIAIPLDKFLEGINLTKQNEIMIPGTEAVDLAKQFAYLFQIIP